MLFQQYRSRDLCNKINSTFVSISTFSLAGNKNVHTPSQGTNKEKYFNHFIYRGKSADSGGRKHPSSTSPFIGRVFSIFRRKNYRPNSLKKKLRSVNFHPDA